MMWLPDPGDRRGQTGRTRLVPLLLLALTLSACAGRQDAVKLLGSLSDTSKQAAATTDKLHAAYTAEVANHIAARKALVTVEQMRQQAVINEYKAEANAAYQTARASVMSGYTGLIDAVDKAAAQAQASVRKQIPTWMKPLQAKFDQVNQAAVAAKKAADAAGANRTILQQQALALTLQAAFASSEYNRIEYEGLTRALDALASEKARIATSAAATRDTFLSDLNARKAAADSMLNAMAKTPSLGDDPQVPEEAFQALQAYMESVEQASAAMQRYMQENSFKSRFMSVAGAFLGGIRSAAIGAITGVGSPVNLQGLVRSGEDLGGMALQNIEDGASGVVSGAEAAWQKEKAQAGSSLIGAAEQAFSDHVADLTENTGSGDTGSGGN